MSALSLDRPLQCHPASEWQPGVVLRVQLRAPFRPGLQAGEATDTATSPTWPGADLLQLDWTVRGPDLSDVSWPAPSLTPVARDGLWQHTCFELFAGAWPATADSPYQEWNVSPSGDWAHYGFAAERRRDLQAEAAAPHSRPLGLVSVQSAEHLRLSFALPIQTGPASLVQGLSCCAVLQHRDGRLSYWSWRHARPVPDFHHAAARLVERVSLTF